MCEIANVLMHPPLLAAYIYIHLTAIDDFINRIFNEKNTVLAVIGPRLTVDLDWRLTY